ncbi:hypothetical protein DDB_G0292622 [Dictyostelium discoideum AX4]|uniref:PH domain-containing protein n=1 Tax=Dictyostelium discoideum TaxID=44689 RepID=Q54CZ1_DICDI|nr:hypothetical protein DDB_G0292622 [Dictyostelium discoideum AX4]EAL61114.1 hypothetical protein DDB_G0292622 [Dictyostelium discoideum AX4]|eukprot:XP_629529.1 hypothetical protein DDB_G0292622 [Dictyostelium discoideum AX4]
MDCVITSGWLQKWSSKVLSESERSILDRSCSGTYHSSMATHGEGSLKARWFILQNDFLNYYDRPPKKIQDYTCLKGQIYLRGCKLKHGGLITPIYQHWSIGVAPNTSGSNQVWKSIVDQHQVNGQMTISLVTPNGVEYSFTNMGGLTNEDTIKNLENWAYSISYAIFLSNKTKDEPMCGWLNKRGEKGHQFKNTKRRWCTLQGTKLRYFSSIPKHNKIGSLKGIIDLTHLSEIADKVLTEVRSKNGTLVSNGNQDWNAQKPLTNGIGSSGGGGGLDCFGNNNQSFSSSSSSPSSSSTTISSSPNNNSSSSSSIQEFDEVSTIVALSLTINNEKKYVLIFDNKEDRIKWVNAITAAVEKSYTSGNALAETVGGGDVFQSINNNNDKQVLVSGWMRKTKANKWWEKRFFQLTQNSLIYYKEDPPQKTLGSIFLLVSSCRIIKQKSLDSLDWCFSIADSRGVEYFFNTETSDQMERWIKAIKVARKKMLLSLLDQGGKLIIPITIGKDCGLITVQTKESIRVNSLSNKLAFEIPMPNVKSVSVSGDQKLDVSFLPLDGEVSEKKVEFITQNPHGVLQLFKDLFSSQENTIN